MNATPEWIASRRKRPGDAGAPPKTGFVGRLRAPWLALAIVAACGGSTTGSIGAQLGHRDDGRLFVREAPPEMTGAKAGLEPGDEILAIDGRDVGALSDEEIRNALRGRVGTRVRLTVKRDGAKRDVEVERGPFAKGG
jgi:carboxyl-terminal processing protease